MLRAPLWHPAERDNPVSPQITNVRRRLATEVAKSGLLPAAAGVTGDFTTVEQHEPDATNLIIRVKATGIAALVNEPQRWSLGISKTLVITDGNMFEHLAPETMCPAWLYDERVRTDTLICGSQTVVDNMYEVLDTETERRLNDDFHAPRIGNRLRIPIFSPPTKAKPAGDPTMFNVRRLLIVSPDRWSKKV